MGAESFNQLRDTFGPFDAYAESVLASGFQFADMKLASGPHVLYASLRWDYAEYVRNYLGSTQRTRDMQEPLYLHLQQTMLAPAVKSWIDLPTDSSREEMCTFGLYRALEAARTASGKSPISLITLLRALYSRDVDILTITSTLRNPTNAYATWPSLPSISNLNSGGLESSLYMPTRREATVPRRYATRHNVPMSSFLKELGELREGQVVLVRGPFGSPLQRLEYILADVLIDGQDKRLPGRFGTFRHVLMQNVSMLHAAAIDGVSRSVENLRHSLSLARMWHTVLILTRGEDLLSNDPAKRAINEHLLSALLQTNGVPVVVAYEDQSEFSFQREIVLPFVSCRIVDMPPYEREHILPAVNKYYADDWKAAGISINSDVLDAVFQLEPIIYAPSTRSGVIKRKVLPYSALELLQETVKTSQLIIDSRGSVRDLALYAKQRIHDILHDPNEGEVLLTAMDKLEEVIQKHADDPTVVSAAMSVKAKWKPRCDVLCDLPERLQRLADRPNIERADGSYVVTQDMVTAQLLAEPTYHLRLVQAFEDDVKAIEPQLLTLLSQSDVDQ